GGPLGRAGRRPDLSLSPAARRDVCRRHTDPGEAFSSGAGAGDGPEDRLAGSGVLRWHRPGGGAGSHYAGPAPEGARSDAAECDGHDVCRADPGRARARQGYEPGTRVVLARNSLDRRNASNLERLVIQLRVEEPLQMTRFRNGEIDLLP